MKLMTKPVTFIAFLAMIALLAIPAAFAAPDERLDAEKIGAAAETKATTTVDGIVRIAWPRNDVPAEDVCQRARRADGECGFERCKGSRSIVRIHAHREAGERQRKRVVLTTRHGRSGVVDRTFEVRLNEPAAQK